MFNCRLYWVSVVVRLYVVCVRSIICGQDYFGLKITSKIKFCRFQDGRLAALQVQMYYTNMAITREWLVQNGPHLQESTAYGPAVRYYHQNFELILTPSVAILKKTNSIAPKPFAQFCIV